MINEQNNYEKLKSQKSHISRSFNSVEILILSQLSHIFASLPNPSDSQLKDLEFVFTFVWGNFRLRRTYLQKCITKVI